MTRVITWMFVVITSLAQAYHYPDNVTTPTALQLLEFKQHHPRPIGLISLSSGAPVDVRDLTSINSDLFSQDILFDSQSSLAAQRPPDRFGSAKGFAVWGHFEVTNDVSKYTSADVFNDIGKKTPILGRLGTGNAERGGSDLGRILKTVALKFYTADGNLDFLNLNLPFSPFQDSRDFPSFVNAVHRNPKTNLFDLTALFDICSLRARAIDTILYFYSDFGVPDGWRHMDFFPIHTYELVNKEGERWYVRFNFRTQQGIRFLTNRQIRQVQSSNADYFFRDMYNALETNNKPSWILEMDILSLQDIQTVDFNPFDTTRLWKNGTYHTVPIGRLTFERNSRNHFRDQEQAAYNPANLVPGIPGPVDQVFKARRFAYKIAQNYRVGHNHNKVGVNAPLFIARNYNRDGNPPVLDNMEDAPTFYPNSFNGPVPFVDNLKPKEKLEILETNAVDLQHTANFYNNYLPTDASRQRLSENLAEVLLNQIIEPTKGRFLRYINLIDADFSHRVITAMKALARKPEQFQCRCK